MFDRYVIANISLCLSKIRRTKTFCVFILLFSSYLVFSQKENHTWIIGQQYLNRKVTSLDTGIEKTFGGNIFDFNNNPVSISRTPKNLSLSRLVINYCDKSGRLLFYSNGSKIFNSNHELIENADSLNYSKDWENPKDSGYYAMRSISIWDQSMLVSRSPVNNNQYHIISLYLDWGALKPDLRAFTKVQYSLMDMSLNNGKGKLILKEWIVDTGNFGNGLWACKKANGIDWWIFVRSMNKSNCFHKYSLDSRGLTLESEKECLGYIMWSKDNDTLPNIHTGNFSPNGKYFAFASFYGLEIFDFDRCSGKLSNRRAKNYPIVDSFVNLGSYAPVSLFFAPNNKFLYYSIGTRIFQYDLETSDIFSSIQTVAVYDGFKDHLNGDTTLVGFPTFFNQGVLAPDGRIYVGHPSTRYMSYFENPNGKGLASGFKQHTIRTESYCGNPPYHPNYDLGAMDCCYGGINKDVATDLKSIIALENNGQYQWLYCDSNFKPIPNATNKSYTPTATGNFAVQINKGLCSDTSDCGNFVVQRASISLTNNDAKVVISPNPAREFTLLKFSTIPDEDVSITMVDILGRIVFQQNKRLNSTILELNTSQYLSGIYIIQVSIKDVSVLNIKLKIEK